MPQHAQSHAAAPAPTSPAAQEDAQNVISGEMHSVDPVMAQREAERARTELITVGKTAQLGTLLFHATNGFSLITSATDDAIAEIEEPELPKTDVVWDLLTMAGATAITACATPVSAGVVGAFTSVQKFKDMAAKTASDLAVAAFKKSMGKPDLLRAASMKEVKLAFRNLVHKQQEAAKQRFAAQWTGVATHLGLLPDDRLAYLNERLASIDTGAQFQAIKRVVMVTWTNFLAQAKHGGMRGWDHWAENGSRGALKLKDSESKPASIHDADPTAGNVAAGRLGWAFKNTQRGGLDEHFGLLEIFLYRETHGLVGASGYGMRLDNVGPKVRAELRQMGSVRDLKVNKVVRICSHHKDGMYLADPVIVGGVVITADGYVRRNEMSAPLHFKQTEQGSALDPTGFRKCTDNLIHQRETSDCHIEHDVSDAKAGVLAEAAQNMPLTYLEV
jgi:hypothetical protein